MHACKKFKKLFIEAFYEELGTDKLRDLKAHLEKCPQCRKEYNQMQKTIKQMDKDKIPDPGEKFWDHYWTKLDQRMMDENIQIQSAAEPGNIISMQPNLRIWTIRILSAAAMLLAGIGIGYLYFGNPEPVRQTISGRIPIQKAAYPQETADYLENSKILLLGFVNFDTDAIDPTTMDFSRQQQAARALIQQAAVLKEDLKGKENQRVLALIRELEIILLQISNYEKEIDIPAIDLIKSGVDNSAILMKINLEEIMRAASEENNKSLQKETSKRTIQEL